MRDPGWHQEEAARPERLATVTFLPGARAAQAPVDAEAAAPGRPESEQARGTTRAERKAGSFDRISNVSMYALARRGMSSKEMADYLIGREFEATDVDEEIARLAGVQLLDDELLATELVRTLRDRKGLGRTAIVAELRRRRIEPLAIESALAADEGDDELTRATEIAVKRAPQLGSLDAETARRRLGAFLMRKGYSGSVVSAAVAVALRRNAGPQSTGPVFR